MDVKIRGAWKDVNCKGNGSITYRKVWANNSWEWVASGYLPQGTRLAAERQVTIYGFVAPDALIVQFSKPVGRFKSRALIDAVYRVPLEGDELQNTDWKEQRGGILIEGNKYPHPFTR